MSPRSYRWAILIIGVVGINMASIGAAARSEFPAPLVVFAYALLFSEAGLIAVWSGVSAARWWIRAVGHSTAFIAAVFAAEGVRGTHGYYGDWIGLFASQSLAISGPLLGARLFGLRLGRNTDDVRAAPLQFTLRHLFIGTTILACLLGLGRAIYPLLVDGNNALEMCLLGSGFAAVALIAAWAAFGGGAPGVKLVVLIVTAVAVGWLFAMLEPPNDLIPIIALVVAHTALLALSLLLFRRAGYRLIRRRE